MEFLIMVDILLNVFPQTGNLLPRQISKTKSTNQLDFFANKVIYFWKKLSNQIKNSEKILKIRLDGFGINGMKKNREKFWDLFDELPNRIWSVYKCCINSVYVLCQYSLFTFHMS